MHLYLGFYYLCGLPQNFWARICPAHLKLSVRWQSSLPACISSRRLSRWSLQEARDLISSSSYLCHFQLFHFSFEFQISDFSVYSVNSPLSFSGAPQRIWILLHGAMSSRIQFRTVSWEGCESGQEGEVKVASMLQRLQDLMANNKHFNLVIWLANFYVGNCRRGRDRGPGLVARWHSCFKSLKHKLNGHWLQSSEQPCWVKVWLRTSWRSSLVVQCVNRPHGCRPSATASKRREAPRSGKAVPGPACWAGKRERMQWVQVVEGKKAEWPKLFQLIFCWSRYFWKGPLLQSFLRGAFALFPPRE